MEILFSMGSLLQVTVHGEDKCSLFFMLELSEGDIIYFA
jgi:hypothetical protein